jgi:hypothetical protein
MNEHIMAAALAGAALITGGGMAERAEAVANGDALNVTYTASV